MRYRFSLILILVLFSISCHSKQNTVQDVAAPQPTPTVQVAQPAPTPENKPASKQQQDDSLKNVPEIMKRPLTGKELEKALEQLPPQVRSQIRGMAQVPHGTKPGTAPATPTPATPAKH